MRIYSNKKHSLFIHIKDGSFILYHHAEEIIKTTGLNIKSFMILLDLYNSIKKNHFNLPGYLQKRG